MIENEQTTQIEPIKPAKEPIWKKVRIGVPKYATPEDLWNDAVRYFEWCDGNPIDAPSTTILSKKQKASKTNQEVRKQNQLENITRPYTLYGLCAFTGISKWYNFTATYNSKEGFAEVISAIENVISSQQIDGAMAGVFKENLTSRLNGLADRQLQEVNGEVDFKGSFNGFAFLPYTPGLENSEQAKIASGEIRPENPDPEPVYAEIVEYEMVKNGKADS